MLKHLARWFQGPGARHATHPAKPQVRLRVKRLEDRLVPTTFNVNSLADLSLTPGVNTATGAITGTNTVTLRSAIQAANATPGGNAINLNVAGTYKIALVGTAGEVDNAAGEFAISSAGGNLTILNNSGGAVTVDGNNLNRVFDINPLFTVGSAVVTAGGSGYTAAPTVTFTGGGASTEATGSANFSGGSVTTVTVLTPGVGYTSAPTVTISGGGGTGAAATAILTSPAFTVTMQGFTIQNGLAQPGDGAPGSGGGIRDQGDASLTLTNMIVTNNSASADGGGISMENTLSTPWTLTLNASTISSNHAGDAGGGVEEDGTGHVNINTGTVITNNTSVNQGAGVWLDAIQQNAVASVDVNTGGSGFTAVPTVTFSGGGATTQATGTADLNVVSVTVNTHGTGFTAAPTVTITGGGGSGATASANFSGGSVTTVTVLTNGAGYTAVPTVTITGGGGTGATATAVLQVDAVNVTTGGAGYIAPPVVTISGGGGSGATATANLTFVSATLNVTGTLISNNKATSAGTVGGGIGNAGNGTVTITSSTISNNFAAGTGGGFSDENAAGTLIVSNSIFIGNSADDNGGGIFVGGPSATITSTSIRNNSTTADGGGIFDSGITLTVQASTIVGNTANGNGGGIVLETTGTGAAGSTITNSTITANQALNNAGGTDGGGIGADQTGSVSLLNDTINANFADNGGGVFWTGTPGSTFSVQNTIIAQNTASTTGPDADNPAGTFTDNGGNLIGISGAGSGNTGFTAGTTQTGTVGTPLNPLLGPLQNNSGPTVGSPGNTGTLNTEALLPGSPALDLGVAAGAPATDERGFGRPDNGEARPDIGAFETQDVTGNAAFVEALYRDFLHRLGNLTNPNDAGGWVNLLNAGSLSPQQVANGISQSPEALGIIVDGQYLKILRRASDPTGRAGFVNFLESGGTVEQVIVFLFTSPEYAALTGSDSGFVMGLYNVLLGRTGSSGEVAGYVSALPMIGRAAVVSAFLNSPEYRMDEVEQLYGVPLAALTSVASVFPDLLHRAASAAEIAGWVNSGLGILQLEMAFAGSAEYIALAPVFSGGVFV